jgi:predicted nucleic acid-binding protein
MVKALFDTNILIDYLNGVNDARLELAQFGEAAISIVTWMEVLVGASPALEMATRTFLDSFDVIPLDASIAGEAVRLRREHRIKLPDAIIWATATTHSLLLVTRNTKDFPEDHPGVRVPYQR